MTATQKQKIQKMIDARKFWIVKMDFCKEQGFLTEEAYFAGRVNAVEDCLRIMDAEF